MPLKVIGTDGGLLPAAVSRGYVMLMPGEHVDVWVDFAALAGKQVILRSLSFGPGGMGGMDDWKDTVLVWPGERVKVAMKFAPYRGMYMCHCHILEHEDMTMIRNYMLMHPIMPGM